MNAHETDALLRRTRFRIFRVMVVSGGAYIEGADHPNGPYTRLEDEDAVRVLLSNTRPEGRP